MNFETASVQMEKQQPACQMIPVFSDKIAAGKKIKARMN
jgi:hypothetical protein